MERLSRSEWELMRICWRLRRVTVRDVHREDSKAHTRDYRTILTLLSRMTAKGWLRVEKEGQANSYTPAVPKGKALEKEIRRFLREVVGPDPENRAMLRRLLDAESRRGRG